MQNIFLNKKKNEIFVNFLRNTPAVHSLTRFAAAYFSSKIDNGKQKAIVDLFMDTAEIFTSNSPVKS